MSVVPVSDLPARLRLPPPEGGAVDVLVVAGEHSGDEHAARLVRAWRERRPEARVAAIGGPALAAAGAQLLFDLTAYSVVGLVEVLRHYGLFRDLMAETVRWVGEHRPRVVCFVDYPGFNLRLAKALRAGGGGWTPRLAYYIGPQIWAWKAGRRFSMARDLDSLGVIFPFEVASYADTQLDVEFVGHPFVEPGATLPVAVSDDPAAPVLLLPGSRVQPVERIFPVLLAGFATWRGTASGRGARAVVPYPSELIRQRLEGHLAAAPVALRAALELVPVGGAVAARAVLTSSGTMSLACALAGLPGAIAYRAHPLTYWLGRRLVSVPYLGIANLLLGREHYREYLQGAATPARLAAELAAATGDPERRAAALAGAVELRDLLSPPATLDAAAWLDREWAR